MRIKTKYEYTHFGISFKTNKPDHLSLESLLEKNVAKSKSDQFFWDMRYRELYKLFPKEYVVNYFTNLKNEMSNYKEGNTKEMVLYWCDRALAFFSSNNFEKEQEAYRKQYYYSDDNKFLKKYDYKTTYLTDYIEGNWRYRTSLYDFSSSFFRPYLSEFWYKNQREDLVKNYEINMKHFAKLEHDDFNKSLNRFLKDNPKFVEVKDFSDDKYRDCGYYLLVLDEYKQVYIGVAGDIKERLIQHFKKIVPYDRRIFGTVEKSKLSIDSFGCKDITRVFVFVNWRVGYGWSHEDELINAFDNKYVSNRIKGGELLFGLDGETPKEISD